MARPSRSDRIYQRLLRLFPFDFQREYGEDMQAVFRAERRDAGGWRLWTRTLVGFLQTAPAEHWDVFRRDVRDGSRALARNKVVTLVAVASLALGLGANIAIFSVVNAMWFEPLPLPEAERLIRVTDGSAVGSVRFDDYLRYRDVNRTLEHLAAFQDTRVTLRADGPPEVVTATAVSGNYFAALRPRVLLGRAVSDLDDRPGAPAVVMVSEPFWRDRFGADPAVVGRTVVIDRRPFTLIGVTPSSFGGTDRDAPREVWIPWHALEARRPEHANMVGRLAAGVSTAEARAELRAIATQLAGGTQRRPAAVAVYPARMVPPGLTAYVVPFFAFFIVLVWLSMLIPCLNIGSLLLARAAERRREMGVRVALGASRTQLLRQLLTESFLIAASGGVAGTAVFGATVAILVYRFDLSADFSSRMVFDWRVLAFTVAVVLAATVMFGLAPALHCMKTDVTAALKDGEATAPITRSRLRAGFVVGQVAVSALLLVIAALVARTLGNPRVVDPGFNGDAVYIGAVDLGGDYSRERGVRFLDAVLEGLRARSGVMAVSLSGADGPLSIGSAKRDIAGRNQDADVYSRFRVSPGHFRTLGIPLLAGRDFTPGDREGAAPVGIVNEALARRRWPVDSPIGKQIDGLEVVGLVRDADYTMSTGRRALLYVPLAQSYDGDVMLLVKAAGSATSVLSTVRQTIARLDPDVPVSSMAPVNDLADISRLPMRVAAALSGVLGGLSLGLALMGLYGVVAFMVRQRTREIGIRVALGATRARITWLVTGQAMRWTFSGLVLGAAGAAAVARILRFLLHGASAVDPVAVGGVALALAAVAYGACWTAARRAIQVDPMIALRDE
jgi:putative ABC transport system permease protein